MVVTTPVETPVFSLPLKLGCRLFGGWWLKLITHLDFPRPSAGSCVHRASAQHARCDRERVSFSSSVSSLTSSLCCALRSQSGGGRHLRETPSVGTVGLIQLELTCVRCCGRGNKLVYLGVLPGLRHPGAQSQVCYRHASEHAAFDCGEGRTAGWAVLFLSLQLDVALAPV